MYGFTFSSGEIGTNANCPIKFLDFTSSIWYHLYDYQILGLSRLCTVQRILKFRVFLLVCVYILVCNFQYLIFESRGMLSESIFPAVGLCICYQFLD